MIHAQLQLLIERYHRLEFFKKSGGLPNYILKSAEDLFQRSLVIVKKDLGIDGEEYLKSIKGQVDYMDVITMRKMQEDTSDRCGRCKKYQFKDGSYNCKLYDKFLLNCGFYEDSGEDFCERINTCLGICEKCDNCIKVDEYEIRCKIRGMDMLSSEVCTQKRERDKSL